MDFQTNKRICEDVAIIPSKRLKNKIAGFATVRGGSAGPGGARDGGWPTPVAETPEPGPLLPTRPAARPLLTLVMPPAALARAQHLMKRIQRGPVRGISLKLQEEERERRLDFIPDVSSVNCDKIPIDPETKAMLKSLDLDQLPGLQAEIAVLDGGGDRDRKPPYGQRR